MNRLPDTTADLVVGAAEAVVSGRGRSSAADVASFLDLPLPKAEAALALAEDLGLVAINGILYEVASPLARLLTTPVLAQRAAVLRVAVESYKPFRVFRERLHLSGQGVDVAAAQVKSLLQLSEHREVIKQTLVSLGTYCQTVRSTGGGQYEVRFEFEANVTAQLAGAVAELAEAELRIRDWLSEELRKYADQRAVLEPLSESYLKVSEGDARGAVVTAGNAVESYLVQLANDLQVDVSTANGLGAKVAAIDGAKKMPKKLIAVGRYLGNVRNAADHGVDPETGTAWTIRDGTGEDFLRVSVTFMEATFAYKNGRGAEI